jgi:hypothetical protein
MTTINTALESVDSTDLTLVLIITILAIQMLLTTILFTPGRVLRSM